MVVLAIVSWAGMAIYIQNTYIGWPKSSFGGGGGGVVNPNELFGQPKYIPVTTNCCLP